MPRRGGLGHQGHDAIQRAFEQDAQRAPQNFVAADPGPIGNPAATSVETPEEEAIAASLQWWDFDSSRVNQAAYDPQSKQLFVNFVRPYPGRDEYVYEGVEQNEWRNFRRSGSPGKFVNRVLNGKNYHRV